MKNLELIRELHGRDVELRLDEDAKLVLSAPPGSLTDELKTRPIDLPRKDVS